MRQVAFFICLAVLGLGAYLKLFYDVPDAQETINFFVSWFLIIVGGAGILANLFWSTGKKRPGGRE